jgi:hypothetical protein
MTTLTNQLESTAATMRQALTNGARAAHKPLPRGLNIVMQRIHEESGAVRMRLALGRNDVHPSDDDIAACREAFGVPVGTEYETKVVSSFSKKTRSPLTWHVVEMCWYE